jgi:peptide deformylase
MKLEIIKYGHPVLRAKAHPIAAVTEEIRQLAAAMLEAMHANEGLGLAAQQVGQTHAMCVIDIPPEMDVSEQGGPRLNPELTMALILLNPVITAFSEEEDKRSEGCLSFPEIHVPVGRAWSVEVEFLDLESRRQKIRTQGLLARAIQHELDHLHGILLSDRMSPVKKISLAGQLKKLKKDTLAKLHEQG